MTAPRPAARIAAVAAALALPLAAVPAAADQVMVRDARGDMVKVEEGGTNPQPDPTATVGDVLRTRFRYGERYVVARTRLAALDRSGRRFEVWVAIQDGARRTWTAGVEATPRDRAGHTVLLSDRGPVHARCRIRHHVGYADDVVRVAVPARCVGHPRVVRMGILTEHVRRSWHWARLDDGLTPRPPGAPRWTRWLHRG